MNPWYLASSKMSISPLMTLNLPPLLPHWDKLPPLNPVNDHPCPPIFKNIRIEATSNLPREPSEENHRTAPINFSIESITRKPSVAMDTVENNDAKHQEQNDEIIKNRGRPSAVSLQILKQKSLENPFRFKCAVCLRSFPRKKSLDTHKLTHSDVKPFQCTFLNCNRKFKQSGQLKTHFRLHTGEKPFVCTFPRCETAFTHANRKCPTHPQYPLHRRIAAKKSPLQTSRSYDNVFVQTSRSYDNVFGLALDISHKKKVDAWLKSQLTVNEIVETSDNEIVETSNPVVQCNRNVLSSIENKNDVIKLDHTLMYEESNKRLLSAVALVELHDQTGTKMENSNQGLLNTLFSVTK